MRGVRVEHDRVYAPVSGKSRTRQEFRDECDINVIMKKYEATGVMPRFAEKTPRFLDLTELPDFQSAMNLMRDASDAFMRLPSRVRKEFDNDPQKFVAFAEDPENREQLAAWGLTEPVEPPAAPMKVEVVKQPEAPLAPSNEPLKGSK